MMRRFAAQLEPDAAARRGGALSPLYAPLPAALPPALFTVGTEDALRDDTLFMASRWLAEGLAAELEVARSRSIVRSFVSPFVSPSSSSWRRAGSHTASPPSSR